VGSDDSTLAGSAVAEDFEPVAGYLKARATTELVQQRFDGTILELHDNATRRTDQVVVVPVTLVTTDVRVTAVGAVNAVEQSVLDEDVERTKDGRSTHPRSGHMQFNQQIVGTERAPGPLHGVDHRAARASDSIPGLL
jgi:hypothetical protein